MIESIQLKVEENFQSKLGKPSKKNKKCGFFPHLGGWGSTPNPHFLKSVEKGVFCLPKNYWTKKCGKIHAFF